MSTHQKVDHRQTDSVQRYRAFGMVIESDIPLSLPEAAHGDPQDPSGVGVFRVRHASSSETPQPTHYPYSVGGFPYHVDSKRRITISVPQRGRLHIPDPDTLIVDLPDTAEARIDSYVVGLALPFALRLRPIIALHGSAVRTPAHTEDARPCAVVLLGMQGSGKSTTAAMLAARGMPLLCDDVVPVRPPEDARVAEVMPGIPVSKLLPDAYEKLTGTAPEPQDFDGIDKYRRFGPASYRNAELTTAIILEPDAESDATRAQQLTGATKLAALSAHGLVLEGIDHAPAQLGMLAQIANGLPVYRILRPKRADTRDDVCEVIESLLEEQLHSG